MGADGTWTQVPATIDALPLVADWPDLIAQLIPTLCRIRPFDEVPDTLTPTLSHLMGEGARTTIGPFSTKCPIKCPIKGATTCSGRFIENGRSASRHSRSAPGRPIPPRPRLIQHPARSFPVGNAARRGAQLLVFGQRPQEECDAPAGGGIGCG